MKERFYVCGNLSDSLAVDMLFDAIAKTNSSLDIFDENQDPDSPEQKLKEKYLNELIKL